MRFCLRIYLRFTYRAGCARLWDLATGNAVGPQVKPGTPEDDTLSRACVHRHEGRCNSIVVLTDKLVSGGDDGAIKVTRLNSSAIMNAEQLGNPRAHVGWILSLASSPDECSLASGGIDRRICVWRLHSGTCKMSLACELSGFMWSVECISWSGDGHHIAAGGSDRRVRVWSRFTTEAAGQVDDWSLQGVFDGHSWKIACAAWSGNDICVATGSDDRSEIMC